MDNSMIVEKLKELGLNEAESKIYLLLLHQSHNTASQIGRLTGISRPKTYEYLTRLVDKGLCTEILGRVKKYSAINPTVAFKTIQNQLAKDYEKSLSLASILTEELLPLYLLPNQDSNPLDYIKVIREKNSIVNHFESLEKIAQTEVLSLVKLPLVMDLSTTHNPVEFSSLKNNVVYKSIYNRDDMDQPNLLESMEAFAQAGEQVRITNLFPIPFKMYIFDEKIVMFTLEDKTGSDSNLTALIVEHLDLAKGLKNVFEIYWQSSVTLDQYRLEMNN